MSRLSKLRSSFSHSTHTFNEADVNRDARGRFAPKDAAKFIALKIKSKKTGEETEVKGSHSEARNLINDINKLKLFSLSTPAAYRATVGQLQRKYKKSPFILSLINALELERGVSNKSQSVNKIQELEKALSTDSPRKPSLKHKIVNQELSVINNPPDDRLEELKNKTLKPKEKQALSAILAYRESIKDLNEIIEETRNSNLTPEQYENLFTRRNNVWAKMKPALDTAKSLKNDYLSEPVLDNYMQIMGSISRESLGGYKIVLPSTINQIKEKAAPLPC